MSLGYEYGNTCGNFLRTITIQFFRRGRHDDRDVVLVTWTGGEIQTRWGAASLSKHSISRVNADEVNASAVKYQNQKDNKLFRSYEVRVWGLIFSV